MKNKIFIVWSCIFALTTGVLQASNPALSRVYGNPFTPEVPGSQSSPGVGTLDTTFGASNHYYFELNAQISPGNAAALQVLPNGNFLVGLNGTSSAKVAQYNAEGALETASYGSSGVATITLGNNVILASMLDAQSRMLVAGGNTGGAGTAPYIQRVSQDGTVVTNFTGDTSTWYYVAGLAQQSTGNIIAVGYNGTNAQIARYTVAGALDTANFGIAGVVAFTSGANANTGLYNIVVDSSDNIYVAYIDSSLSGDLYVAQFAPNGSFTSITHMSYFDSGATASQVRMAMDYAGNLVVAAQVGNNILVSTLVLTSGSYTNTTITPILTTLNLSALITTSSGTNQQILLIGNDTDGSTTWKQRISGLTSAGPADSNFNPSPGTPSYNEFAVLSSAATNLVAAGIAPDGQIYAVGFETPASTQNPYIYRLNNYQYIAQIQQYPNSQEQGNQDLSFGTSSPEVYRGVTSPINGIYGSLLQQKAKSVVELSTANMIVGIDGLISGSSNSTMTLARLLPTGALDTSATGGWPASGFVTTTNDTSSNEFLNAMGVDVSDNVYVAGTAGTGAIFRQYAAADGSQVWAALDASAGAMGVGVALQGATRALLFEQIDATTGRISAYDPMTGALEDHTQAAPFGQGGAGAQTGQILTGSYGLNMGPVYGGIVSSDGLIYVAYKNSSTNTVSVTAFLADGSGVSTSFAGSGTYADVFGVTTPAVSNIRIAFDRFGQLVVAAVAGDMVYMARLNPGSGALDSTFNSGSPLILTISGATSLQLARLTGISDGTTLLTMSDDAADDSMIVARVLANGTGVDTTFDSQGANPGVLSLKIGSEVTDYNARAATSAMIQSQSGAGSNIGNIVVAAFEEVTADDATPMVMRVYGAAGTTEIKDYPTGVIVPGTFADAVDLSIAPDSLGAGSGNVIFVYPNSSPYLGTMLIGYDNGTTSNVARLYTDTLALDTTFGTSGVYAIPGSLTGISCIAVDANNKILVGGTSSGAGWAKRLTASGGIDVSFTMPSAAGTITAVNGIGQQKSGRYILAAANHISTTDYPVLVAFQDLGSPLVVDPTFNPMLVNSPVASQYGIFAVDLDASGDGLYAFAINSDDTIIAGYVDGDVGVELFQVTADGSGYVNAFNSGLPLEVAEMNADSSASILVAIDDLGNFVIAASSNEGGGGPYEVQVARYTNAGIFDSTFNGGAIQTISNLGNAGITLTGLMETSTQQTVLTGYNTNSVSIGNGPIFAVRLTSLGAPDPTWNPAHIGTDTLGVLTFGSGTIPAAALASSAYIQDDGTIDILGSSPSGTSGDIILMQVYGDDNVYEVVQSQLGLAAGVLDTTLPSGSSGSMLLNGGVIVSGTTPSATILGVPTKIAIYNNTTAGSLLQANGTMMIGSSSSISGNSYVAMLNPDLSANTSYATDGIATIGSSTVGGHTYTMPAMNDMYLTGNTASDVNTTLPILVAGNNGSGVMTAAQVATNGTGGDVTVTYVGNTTGNNPTSMTNGYAIRQSTNNRILVAGYNGTSGVIAAFGSQAVGSVFPVDPSFGNQGVSQTFPTGSATSLTDGGALYIPAAAAGPIFDMVVDSDDRIYIAYYLTSSSGVTINVERLLTDGTGIDSTWNGGAARTITGTAFSISTPIRIALDATHDFVYVAAQDGTSTSNIIRLQRFGTSTGTPATQLNAITISDVELTLSDLFIDALGDVYVVGTNVTDHNSVVARVVMSGFALDTANYAVAGGTPGIANVSAGFITSVIAGALDPDRRTYLVGTNGSNPYIARIAGDAYTSEISEFVAPGVAGTIDPTFGSSNPTAGYYDLSTLSGVDGVIGIGCIALPNGGNYIVMDNGNGISSQLIRTISTGALDNSGPDAYGVSGSGIAELALSGINSMMQDGSGRIVLVGTTYSGSGWIQRYQNGNSGAVDTTFGSSGLINLGASTQATVAVEQTLARLVVAGQNAAGHGALFAYTSIDPLTGTTGAVDTTFNFNGATPGVFDTGVANAISSLVADQYDRLICAQLNGAGNAILLYRFTPTGEIDTTFGTGSNGYVSLGSGVFGSAPDNSGEIFIALNAAGNIVVATHLASGNIGVVVYDNGTANTPNTNGVIYNTAYTISGLTGARLTGLATSADTEDYIYAMGNQSGSNAMWIARLTAAGFDTTVALDTGNFNPGAVSPGVAGIFEYAHLGSTGHLYYGLSIRPDGRIEAIGSETDPTRPVMIRVYNDPYTTEEIQSPDSKPVGTNDVTLGFTGANAVTFYGSTSGNTASSQVAQAIALQDDNNFVVALDGNPSAGSGLSQIMVTKFDNDGQLNLSFNTTGQATVSLPYFGAGANQYAQDMVAFTVGGVHKAIIGGYVTNGTPSLQGSLLLQYNLDSAALDMASFGGLLGNPQGVAFGDAFQINAVGQQSNGRIIASGIAQGGNGVILGYTSSGKLDASFGIGSGYQSENTGTTGLYTHAIDSLNRIVIAYSDGSDYSAGQTVDVVRFLPDGSHDTTFTASSLINGIRAADRMRIAVDTNNNVYVGAIVSGANWFAISSYAAGSGTLLCNGAFTGETLGNSSAVFEVTRLLVDESNNVIFVAYDSNAEEIIIARFINSSGTFVLDNTTNDPSGAFNGVGYVRYQAAGGMVSQKAEDALIHPDGRILIVGSED